jgi:hypothetical protein
MPPPLTIKTGSSGNDPEDDYTGFDRFGRLAETLWIAETETLVHTKYHDAFRLLKLLLRTQTPESFHNILVIRI